MTRELATFALSPFIVNHSGQLCSMFKHYYYCLHHLHCVSHRGIPRKHNHSSEEEREPGPRIKPQHSSVGPLSFSFSHCWLFPASNTDSLLGNVCVCVYTTVAALTNARPTLCSRPQVCVYLPTSFFPKQHLASSDVVYLCMCCMYCKWDLSVCVCVHFVTDVGSCMFGLGEEVRNITALL